MIRAGAGAAGGAALALIAAPALAQEPAEFCPSRPDISASPCITAPGKVHVELSAIDWQRDDNAEAREDAVIAGDLLLRIGVGGSTELQLGWTAFGDVRTRDQALGMRKRSNRTGDVLVGLRHRLTPDDGRAFATAMQPFVTLPVGRMPIGAGDWGGGVAIPLTYDLSDDWTAGFTGQVEAAVDEDGDGRHLAYSGIVELSRDLGDRLSANLEFSLERDRDPGGHATIALTAASLAFRPGRSWQVDVLAVGGLNGTSPDFRLVLGGAALF